MLFKWLTIVFSIWCYQYYTWAVNSKTVKTVHSISPFLQLMPDCFPLALFNMLLQEQL